MSSPMKLSLLALVSTVAAVPHYGHSKFHKPSGGYGTGTGKAYPTGGWGGHHNSTGPHPTGTGSSVYPDSKPTTTYLTQFSTETIVETIYATRPGAGSSAAVASSVGVADVVSTGGACGPATIYVTATDKVTVTVPAGGAPSSAYTPVSSVAEAVSSAPASSAPAGGYSAPPVSFVLPSSSAVVEQVSTSKPHKPAYTPSSAAQESSKAVYSIVPVSSAPAVVSSAPVSTPAYTPSPAPVSSAAPASSAPVSSATPSPSSSPSYSGGKRGLAYNEADLCTSFSASKFSFAYNWGQTVSGTLPAGVKFVPMMHNPTDSTAEAWLANVDTAVKGGSTAVMGFNEPDESSQANMTPEQACADWTTYMEPIVSAHPDVTILGPSVTNGGAPMGLTWLSAFQSACPSATWHAANIHFYDIYDEGTVGRFQAQVEKAAQLYGKPVWVTEFGLNPGSATDDQAATFLKACMDYMDGSDSVQGYSYFMVGTGQYQLNSGAGLSGTGEVYNS